MAKKIGAVFWNIFAYLNYRANTVLPCTMSVVNTDDETHEFMVKLKTFDASNNQVEDQTFTIDGFAWTRLDAGERVDGSGFIVLVQSNVTLGAYLIERVTEAEVDSIFTYLRSY